MTTPGPNDRLMRPLGIRGLAARRNGIDMNSDGISGMPGTPPADRPDTRGASSPAERERVLLLHEEEAVIARRVVPGDTVRVRTVTRHRDHLVRETLRRRRVEVERIPVGTYVDEAPPIRHEGDVTILSVVEEVVVVERRLLLREEVHLRTVSTAEDYTETVSVRSEDAVIERIAPVADGADA